MTLAQRPPESSPAKKKEPPGKEVQPKKEELPPQDTLQKASVVVRGIYITSWTAGSGRMPELVRFVKNHRLNSMVIDIKDDTGAVSYLSEVPLARKTAADSKRIADPKKLLATLKSEGIYPIARIVAFKDPHLAKKRPDLAVKSTYGGSWQDRRGQAWVSPYSREVWEYLVALGKEAIELGFAEVQYDYVRFPSDGKLAHVVYPEGKPNSKKIGEFLSYATYAIRSVSPGAIVSADTFGLAGSATDDLGIGQRIEDLDGTCDYLSPMAYPSHYAPRTYGLANPNANPHDTVKKSMADHQRRVTKSRLRPWLQAFTLGSPPYGPSQLAAQLRALEELGIGEFLLWNPSSRYGAVAGGL